MNKKRFYLCLFLVGLLTLSSVFSALASLDGEQLPDVVEVVGQAEAFESVQGRSAASDLADYTRLDTFAISCNSLSPSTQFGNSISFPSTFYSNDVKYYFSGVKLNSGFSRYELIFEYIFENGYDPELIYFATGNKLVGVSYFLPCLTSDNGSDSLLSSSRASSGIAYIDEHIIRVSYVVPFLMAFRDTPGYMIIPSKLVNGPVSMNVYVKAYEDSVTDVGGGGEGGGTGGSGSVT